jgi:hypothetical protein
MTNIVKISKGLVYTSLYFEEGYTLGIKRLLGILFLTIQAFRLIYNIGN